VSIREIISWDIDAYNFRKLLTWMMELAIEAGWDFFLPSPHLPLIIIFKFHPKLYNPC